MFSLQIPRDSTHTLLLDVDGVLTNGDVVMTHDGQRSKSFSSLDVRAISEFVSHGWVVYLISTSGWPGVHDFARNSGAIIKTDFLKTHENIEALVREPYVAVGDDLWDIEMLRGAQLAFTPQGSWLQGTIKRGIIQDLNLVVLETPGGRGVVAELAEWYFGGTYGSGS